MAYDQRQMKRQPVLGRFGIGLSYGLPIGVTVAGLLAVVSDEPDMGVLVWLGILVAVGVALVVMRLVRRRTNG